MARSLYAGGARPGDIIHNAYGYGLFTGGLGAHYGAERLGCTVVPMSGGFGERQVQLIREFGARVVLMTPSYMLAIADEFERQGIDPRETAMRIGIFGAEPWTEGMRAEIERRLGIDAGRHLWAERSDGAGRRLRVRRDQGRADDLGGPLLSRDRRSRDRRADRRGRTR
jgi:phenylacetate-coenzyme A ligase PaaK-like adenylate-forming protein